MANPVLGDRYEIQRQLGQKAGRRTLLARDLQTKEFVVVKLLAFDSELEWDDLKLFDREAETLRSLSHPAIPRYLDHFDLEMRHGKGFALVQTYINGKSLDQFLQSGRKFSEAESKQVAKAVLEILAYLHGRNPPVIHRDIKPSNILLSLRAGDNSAQVHLIDFGSVKSRAEQESSSSSFTIVGTYGYIPPEQSAGRAVTASDLYSLGATLITVATGIHPSSLPRRGLRIDFEQLEGLSAGFADWLSWMTEPTLDRRLSSAKEALEVLEAGRTRKETSAKVPPPTDTKVNLTKDTETLEVTLPTMVGQIRLVIDAQQISLSNQVIGMMLNRPQTAPRPNINKLEYIKSRLTIWAGNQKFELGSNLSEAELNWLAYELASWLKLPLVTS